MKKASKTIISLEEALKNGNNTVNQEIKGQFIAKHVMSNVNGMVEYILSKGHEDNDTPFNIDDIENYYSFPEFFGQKASFYGGSENERGEEIERLKDLINDILDQEETVNSTESNISVIESEIEELEALESKPQEIFEWWIVSDFLCKKLSELGHPVISNENLWGRCCSGQAILLDYAITKICADMGILEGQENSWAK